MLKVAYISPDGKCIEHFEMADGMTLEQAARTICPDSAGKFPAPTIAIVGAKPAVRELGDWDWPLHGAQVQFRQLALGGGGGGGGSNPVQMVLQIAIIAAAVAASVMIPGLGTFAGGATLLGMTGATWGAIAGAGIMLLGSMLMGALFQQKLPQGQSGAMSAEQSSPTYSINSSGNQARLYQQEPETFGRMKIVPDYVAQTWTQYVGNDQIGYFVYGLGRGRYRVESLQFGETVFWRNGALVADSGYEIERLEIVEPGNPVTIFPDNVISSEEVAGQSLFAPNDEEFDGAIGPYAANSAGTKTDRLLFDFVFQQGLGRYDDAGALQAFEVKWRIEYRRIDDFGAPLSGCAVLDEPSEKMATTTPQRITKSYAVAQGRYEARVVRLSDTSADGRTLDALAWGAMRAMLPGTYEYPVTCVAFSIRANNALTQNASRQFSAIVTRKLPLYDRATKKWSAETPTRSWAAAVSHVARCEWGGKLPDSSIDLDALWRIDEALQAKGWFYDACIDGPTLVWTLLCEMCQSQGVICRLVGPVLSFIQDAPNRLPSFALTPRNIVRDSFSVTYSTWSDETPDDVTLEYLDAAYGFQQRDVTAKLPDSESREPASLDILGITGRSHAHKIAVAYAAHNRWQRVCVECQVEALGRIINRGDVCTVAHPRFKNTAAGAVAAWDKTTLEIVIKRDMGRAPAAGQYISLSRPDGSIWGPCKVAGIAGDSVRLDSGDYSTLLLQGQGNPFEWLTSGADRQPTTWTLYAAKTYQRLMVVDGVNTQDGLHFGLRLLNYDSRIYQYENLPVPAWQGRGQLPVATSLAAPKNLLGRAATSSSLVLTWLTVPGAEWYEVQVSANGVNWRNLGRANLNALTATVAPGPVHARVRAANDSLQSAWATWAGDTTLAPPAMPKIVAGEYRGGLRDAFLGGSRRRKRLRSYSQKRLESRLCGDDDANALFDKPEIQEGGPYRNLVCTVVAKGAGGVSQEAKTRLDDPAPAAPQAAEIVISGNSLTLEAAMPAPGEDFAGYVVIKGATPYFTAAQVQEMRKIERLPYTWAGLATGEHYFRLAERDEFSAISGNLSDLNWSGVFTALIGNENE